MNRQSLAIPAAMILAALAVLTASILSALVVHARRVIGMWGRRRFALKLSSLMGLIALAAILLSVGGYAGRARRYEAMAVEQDRQADSCTKYANVIRGYLANPNSYPVLKGHVRREATKHVPYLEAAAKYHRRRRDELQRCARFPWLTPSPDPGVPPVGSNVTFVLGPDGRSLGFFVD